MLCRPGSFLRNGTCVDCPEGTYQPYTMQTVCYDCPQNYTSPNGSVHIKSCTGIYASVSPSYDISYWELFSSYFKASQHCYIIIFNICQHCYIIIFNICFVEKCPAGSYLSGETCKACAPGTYQPLTMQTFCLDCPAKFTSPQGSVHHDNCTG